MDYKDPAARRLEELILELRKEVAKKHQEIQELKDRIMQLQRARNVIAHELESPYGPVAPPEELQLELLGAKDFGRLRPTLRLAAIMALKRLGATSPETARSAGEIASVMDRRRDEDMSRGRFYSMVYITLRRAHTSGALEAIETDKGRRFYLKNPR